METCQDGVLPVRMTRRVRGNAERLQLLGRQGGDRVLDLVHPGTTDVEGFVPRSVAGPSGAGQALTALVLGGPARIVGRYSSSWMRPSKVRLLIMSRATSG